MTFSTKFKLSMTGVGILIAWYWAWASFAGHPYTQGDANKAADAIVASCDKTPSCRNHFHQQADNPPLVVVPPPPPPAVPAGGYDRVTWARALLAMLKYSPTAENVRGVVAWEQAEGGHWQDAATYNPLNTTMPMPGSHPINAANVQAFTNWNQGLQATVLTLRNGLYGNILAALQAGNCASCLRDAVAGSRWGTQYFAV